MSDPEKITIVEGPAPAFEAVVDPWVYGLAEGPVLKRTVRCVLRTFNGPALVERCHNAWRDGREVFLDYRDNSGLRDEALILASRYDETPDGHLLQLWVMLDADAEIALDDGDADIDTDADSDADAPFN